MNTIVFKGLMRPAMQFGVPVVFLTLELMITTFGFIATQNFWLFLYVGIIHLAGCLISLRDPFLFQILYAAYITTPMIQNKRFWRCQSYAAF